MLIIAWYLCVADSNIRFVVSYKDFNPLDNSRAVQQIAAQNIVLACDPTSAKRLYDAMRKSAGEDFRLLPLPEARGCDHSQSIHSSLFLIYFKIHVISLVILG